MTAFDKSFIDNLDSDLNRIEREIKYPSFSYVDSKPITANRMTEANRNRDDMGKVKYNGIQDNYDVVGASFWILDQLYRENNWVQLAIKTIGASCTATNPIFKLKSSKGVGKTTINKYNQLFSNPNAFTTAFDLFTSTYMSLGQYGNAYWQIIRKMNGEIHSFHFIPAHMVRVIPYIDKNTQMMDYVYAQVDEYSNNIKRYFYSNEIIHFKMPNHLGRHYGLSTVVSLLRDITFDLEAKNHINSWFQKAFSGGMIFKMENSTKEVVNRNRSEMREKFEGASNAGRNLILEGDMNIVYDGNKIRDIDFSKLKQISRDDILTCFGVPLSIAGVRSDVGQANVEVIGAEEKAMLRNTVNVYQKVVFETLTLRFFRVIMGEENISITNGANSSFVQKNAESFVMTASKFGGNTVNENREILGLDTKDGLDNFDTPLVATNNGVVSMDDLFTNFAEGGKQGNSTVKTPSVAVGTSEGDIKAK